MSSKEMIKVQPFEKVLVSVWVAKEGIDDKI